jgi:hypothetical protein
MSREIMQKALDYIKETYDFCAVMQQSKEREEQLIKALEAELAKPEPEPKLTDAGAETNITRGLEPKGSGMVTLNQPEQEPIGWFLKDHLETYMESYKDIEGAIPLYTSPPRKEWVGLSVNEGRDFFESKLTRAELITEISEFLEEKNNAV